MDYFNGTAVLNTSGVVQERYAYSAFGVRRIMAADFTPRSSSSFAWDFGFQGQFGDAEKWWYNYGYRFYVPLLGRWINRDPIGERGGVNLYAFVNNATLNESDWHGLAAAPNETPPGVWPPEKLPPDRDPDSGRGGMRGGLQATRSRRQELAKGLNRRSELGSGGEMTTAAGRYKHQVRP
jgi:RHS repeat-associated protein